MKNNDTFNQILNSNLASIDPGFGQFALAKASAMSIICATQSRQYIAFRQLRTNLTATYQRT